MVRDQAVTRPSQFTFGPFRLFPARQLLLEGDRPVRLGSRACDILTIGQYLRPTANHLEVARFVTPAEFDRYREAGLGLGFKYVASGPLVRSSYRAAEAFLKGVLKAGDDAVAGANHAPYSDRYGKRRLEVVS